VKNIVYLNHISLLIAMGLYFYVLFVVTTGNETNEYDIGREDMEKVRNV